MNCIICGKKMKKGLKKCCSRRCVSFYSNISRNRKRVRLTNGYREIYHPDHNRKNKYIREHLLVMSKEIGRDVKYPENVHHIDGDKLNNDISNLCLCANVSEHMKIHHSMELIVQELYKKGMIKFNKKIKRYETEEAVARLFLKLAGIE